MTKNFQADIIVVGAGPSGISAALCAAKEGKKVVLIERATHAGSKNMYGGAVYTSALKEIFGEDLSSIPYERVINSHTWSFLNDTGSVDITYKNNPSKNALAITRFKLEAWMVEKAKEQGVYYIPNTLVKNLILEDGKVIGIKTELEEYYAPITILADGVNSLLAKEIGLRADYNPKDMILSVKETLKLDKKIIEERFNLKQDCTNGACKMYFGGFNEVKNLFMMTYLYTFKNTIMLGVGINLQDLNRNKLNINEVLDKIKTHPDIKPLIEGAELLEYSAHLIPEGGYNTIPRLYTNGALIVGDAAGFVNGVHFEGTNFALISGKLAAQTAINALNNDDYSERSLSTYRKKLENSFILQDLYSYRNVIEKLHSRSCSLSYYYPKKMREFFEIITGAKLISKSQSLRKFAFDFIKERKLSELLKDFFAFSKCLLDVFFGK